MTRFELRKKYGTAKIRNVLVTPKICLCPYLALFPVRQHLAAFCLSILGRKRILYK